MVLKKVVRQVLIVVMFSWGAMGFQAGADTIRFKDGRIIEGDILERDSRSVEFDYYGTPMTYYIEDIERINGEPVSGVSTTQGVPAEESDRDSFPRQSDRDTQSWGQPSPESKKSTGGEVLLELNLSEGFQYNIRYMTNQKIVQDIGGQIQEILQDTEFSYVYTVEEVNSSGDMIIAIRYDSIRFNQHGPFGYVSYDSDNPPQKVHPAALGYDVMVGESFRITVSETGEIISVTGMDFILDKLLQRMSIPEGADENTVKETLSEQFGDQALKDSIGNLFAVYPSFPVRVGDSWEKTEDTAIGFPMRVVTTYTLDDISSGQARVKSSSVIHSRDESDPVNMGGMSLRYEVSGSQEGSTILDVDRGWTIRGQVSQKIGGKVLVISGEKIPLGTSWPISIESTISFEPF